MVISENQVLLRVWRGSLSWPDPHRGDIRTLAPDPDPYRRPFQAGGESLPDGSTDSGNQGAGRQDV